LDELLERLTGVAGLTGTEGPAAEVVRELWKPLVDELTTDRVGNVVGVKRGDGPDGERLKLAAVAHLDQIGMEVYRIEAGGFLRLQMVGGVDKRILPGQVLTVHGSEPLRGVVGATPPHLQSPDERKQVVGWDDLFLDLGLPEAEVRDKVAVGDPVSFPSDYTRLDGAVRAVAACDDRSAVAAVTWALRLAQRRRHFHDLVAVAGVQEEWTGLGAAGFTYANRPDAVLVVDVDQGRHEGVPEKDSIELGQGVAVTFGLNNHPKLVEALERAAGESGVTKQKIFWYSPYGTDGSTIEVSAGGVPTANLGIPLRYMHSTVETVNLDDIKAVGRLIIAAADSRDLPVFRPVDW
jgi:endoglucanase